MRGLDRFRFGFKSVALVASLTAFASQGNAATIAQWTVPNGTTLPYVGSTSATINADIGTGTLFATRVIVGARNPTVEKTFGVSQSGNSPIPTADDGTGVFTAFAHRFPTAPATLNIEVSTLGQSGIVFSADTVRGSISSGVSYSYLYSVDNSIFHPFGGSSPTGIGNWVNGTFNISDIATANSFASPDNLATLYLQVQLRGGSLTGNPGTGAIDNLTISSLNSTSVVPLPAALPLFGTGLGLLGLIGWRRRRRAA